MKASVWRSHPRHVPLFTVTMMGKKRYTGNLSTEYPGRGGCVNITMIFMVTSSHFMGPNQ